MRYLPLVFLLAACASDGSEFTKQVSDSEKARDVEYCSTYAEAHKTARVNSGLAGIAAMTSQRDNLFKLCMLDRGYATSQR